MSPKRPRSFPYTDPRLTAKLVPVEGFEPPSFGLKDRGSAVELHRIKKLLGQDSNPHCSS